MTRAGPRALKTLRYEAGDSQLDSKVETHQLLRVPWPVRIGE